MAFAVVATANHYILDVVAGVTLGCWSGIAVALARSSAVARRPTRRPPPRPGGSVTCSRSPTGPATPWPACTRPTCLGVDVIECDVHAHRGRLEVRHLKTAGPLALPLGPVGAGLRLGAPARPRRAARGRPARDHVHARPQGPAGVDRPGRRRAAARRARPRPSWCAGGTGRRWTPWPSSPSCGRSSPPATAPSWPRSSDGSDRASAPPHGVSVHAIAARRARRGRAAEHVDGGDDLADQRPGDCSTASSASA